MTKKEPCPPGASAEAQKCWMGSETASTREDFKTNHAKAYAAPAHKPTITSVYSVSLPVWAVWSQWSNNSRIGQRKHTSKISVATIFEARDSIRLSISLGGAPLLKETGRTEAARPAQIAVIRFTWLFAVRRVGHEQSGADYPHDVDSTGHPLALQGIIPGQSAVATLQASDKIAGAMRRKILYPNLSQYAANRPQTVQRGRLEFSAI